MTDSLYAALSARMNYLGERQSLISQNVANADTPGYIAKDLADPAGDSSASGAFAMVLTNAKHQLGGNSATGRGKVTESREYLQHNGNSVKLDQEMLKMSQVQTSYRMMTELYTKQIQLQSIALKGQ